MKDKIIDLKDSKMGEYILAFTIPLIMSMVVFGVLGIYPFGNEMYLRSDSYEQYVRFLEFLQRVLYEGDFSQLLYTFSNGFGHGAILYVAYYLLSPFNILVVLLPFLKIELVFMIIMMLKVASLGLSFYYFIDRYNFNLGKAGYMFSTTYTFISFVTLYSMNIMWLDSLILLPIILVQLKEMFDTNKVLKFTILMLVLYVSNFYMALMICLLLVILLILSFIFDKNVRVDVKRKIKLFVTSVGISVLLFGILMVPVIYELTEFYTDSGEYTRMQELTLAKIVAKLFAFKYDTFFSMKYFMSMTPCIYFGLLPLILSVVYVLFGKNDSKKKILVSLGVVIVISFIVPGLNMMWHGFDVPTGFDYRYSFLLSFVGLVAACEGFKYFCKNGLSKKELLILFIALSLLFVVGAKEVSAWVLGLNIFIVVLYFAIIALSKSFSMWKEKIMIIFLLELIVNAIVLNMMLNAQMGIVSKEEYFNEKSSETIKMIVDKYVDNDYRMLIERNAIPSVNTPIEIGYNGVSSFNSSVNFNFIDKLSSLGLFRIGELVYILDSNYITDSLLSVKYIISERELELYDKKEEIVINENKVYLYENPYVMPIGFIPKDKIEEIKSTNIEENILDIASSISGKKYDRNIYKEYSPIKVTINEKEILPNENGDYILKSSDLAEDGRSYLKIEYPKGLNLMNRVGKIEELEASNLLINNKDEYGNYRNSPNYYNKIDKELSSLEFYIYASEWETIDNKSMNLGQLKGLEVDEEYTKSILEDMTSVNSVDVTYRKNGHFKLNINSESKGEILFTSIPYSKSWKAKVNGKEFDLINSEIDTLSLKLEKGLNEIELIYIPRGLGIGASMTLLGAVLLIIRIKKFE